MRVAFRSGPPHFPSKSIVRSRPGTQAKSHRIRAVQLKNDEDPPACVMLEYLNAVLRPAQKGATRR